jgi:hypothetical protein
MMSIIVREEAAKLILEAMKKENLDPSVEALKVDIKMGAIGVMFTNEYNAVTDFFGLKVVTDPIVVDDVIIDHYTISDGRKGLIFLEKEELCQSQ